MTTFRYLTLWSLAFLGCLLFWQDLARSQTANLSALNELEFRAELDRLATICDSYGLVKQSEHTRRWLAAPRGDQLELYLPGQFENEQTGSTITSGWAQSFNAARIRFAKFLFEQAAAVVESDEHRAYQLVWHTLREDPTHEQAKQVLGPLARGINSRPRLVRARDRSREFGWPAGSYSFVKTPHFRVTTRAGGKESLQLAQQLEEYYALWTQFFFPLWERPGVVQDKLSGLSTEWPRQREIEVVFLNDRDEYLKVLGVSEDNIGVSVGYYNPGLRKSFFYPSADIDATLTHELTHQLLLEATHFGAQPEAGTESGIWILEGIAIYMESLSRRGDYWTLGGAESPRLQTARYRGVRDGFWPPWNQFSSAGIDDWKSDRDLARLYSHAAGLTHVLLDAMGPSSRNAYFQALIGQYQGNVEPQQALLAVLGETEDIAKSAYQEALVIQDEDVEAMTSGPAHPRELVLCGSQLDPHSWRKLGEFTDLEWLDVSFSNIRTVDLAWLPEMSALQRLSLEGTAVEGDVLRLVTQLPALKELDLSGCGIDDTAFDLLSNHQTLEVLWLSQNPLSDAALSTLGTMPRLKQCDVQQTAVSAEQWSRFVRKHPRLSR